MNIGIIGLGLMGGSFGRMLYKRGQDTVYGLDISRATMQKAELMHAYHHVLTLDDAKCLDMLVAALYPSSFEEAVTPYLPYLKEGAVVCDFGGTKSTVAARMQTMAQLYPQLVFVGGHPMAGREFSGIEHSTAGLFERASMILVPVNADIYCLQRLKQFFLGLGFGRVEITDAATHDKTIAYTSQLCHIVSNAFIKNEQAQHHAGYSAGSYRDLTRVARLNPTMWTQLMMDNRDNLSQELAELIANLQQYQTALDSADADELYRLLEEGNERKLAIDVGGNKNA